MGSCCPLRAGKPLGQQGPGDSCASCMGGSDIQAPTLCKELRVELVGMEEHEGWWSQALVSSDMVPGVHYRVSATHKHQSRPLGIPAYPWQGALGDRHTEVMLSTSGQP